tara:strand:- start:2379 stop:2489 length:111 start_codon:yes stop_codon:yes gene_type:complete
MHNGKQCPLNAPPTNTKKMAKKNYPMRGYSKKRNGS